MHCYVGFDIFSGPVARAPRVKSKKRLGTGRARVHKVRTLGKVLRGRIRKLLATGVAPQFLHNAQVSGANETELKEARSLMGKCSG